MIIRVFLRGSIVLHLIEPYEIRLERFLEHLHIPDFSLASNDMRLRLRGFGWCVVFRINFPKFATVDFF